MESMGGHAGADCSRVGWSKERGQTGLVGAPGVVCRVSADLHCLAHQSDGGTPSETLPGSTKTGTGGT